MAHGDYDCCAVCDNKQSFSYDPETKSEICSSCVAGLARQGVILGSVSELMDWIRQGSEDVRAALEKVGFLRCYYLNDVDALVQEKFPDLGRRK